MVGKKTKRSKASGLMNAIEGRQGALGIEKAISSRLKQFYDSVADEGIPDRFLELLDKLDEAEKAAKLKQGQASDGN